jgi:hypothetical protein
VKRKIEALTQGHNILLHCEVGHHCPTIGGKCWDEAVGIIPLPNETCLVVCARHAKAWDAMERRDQ